MYKSPYRSGPVQFILFKSFNFLPQAENWSWEVVNGEMVVVVRKVSVDRGKDKK